MAKKESGPVFAFDAVESPRNSFEGPRDFFVGERVTFKVDPPAAAKGLLFDPGDTPKAAAAEFGRDGTVFHTYVGPGTFTATAYSDAAHEQCIVTIHAHPGQRKLDEQQPAPSEEPATEEKPKSSPRKKK